MPSSTAAPASPVVLVANHDELFARSLESVLAPAGYAVLRAYNGRMALDRARRSLPDALILGTDLADPDGSTVCRLLRDDPEITPSTPIFLTHPGPTTRPQRLEALRAGACELWGQPLDLEEFLLRLAARLRSKLDADRAREEGLVDPATGLYNGDGLARRVRELLADAARRRVPMSLVVVGPESRGREAAELGEMLARALSQTTRRSDTIASLGGLQFAVLAPATGAEGAARLSERLLGALDVTLSGAADDVQVSAGYETLADPASEPSDPETLIGRALAAFHTRPNGGRIRRWAL